MAAQHLILVGLLGLGGCLRTPPAPPVPSGHHVEESRGERGWPPTLHEARRHYLTALMLAEAERLDEAERSLQRGALFDPGSASMELGYGRFLVELEWLEQSCLA